jgi:hypothetical protein
MGVCCIIEWLDFSVIFVSILLKDIEWGKVAVNWWTHKIGGLHKNDFIMAAKTDQIYG